MSRVSTDQIIKEIARETGEPGLHNYTTLQGYLLDSIRDMNIFSMPTWSTQTAALTPFNTIKWACDCVKPIMTVLNRGGSFYLLSVSDDIIGTVMGNAPQPTTGGIEDLYSVDGYLETYGWNVWDWDLGEIYGAGTILPPFGYVIHDKANRQSYIKGITVMTGDVVTMLYKSDGLTQCPMYIPSECKEVTEFFMLMKWFRVRNPGLSQEMDAKHKERLFRVQRLWSDDGGLDAWTRAVKSNTVSTVKI